MDIDKIKIKWEEIRKNPQYAEHYREVRLAFKKNPAQGRALENNYLKRWGLGGMPDPTLSFDEHRERLDERKFKYWLRYFVGSLAI